ncbi:FISUMP domain-containing protein [Dysgonomonas sp. 25]|uniref:FISUMP domain-containing protein n=1 Tax=Dysgonomonas sp. 25 TaxID=2302933 RepID=UPI0013CF9A5B|nr:FISUMP domain-containing protein [Dysgonomonas sp. 25]NDV69581.1 hypothetical protein [Dysgonomonas sp. 25]
MFMKQKILAQAIIILALIVTTSSLHAQVSIGSPEAPNKGALLDLKMDNQGMSTKGLAMPRVTLTDKDKLYPMLANGYAASEDAAHTGLIVYHNDKCTMDGKGLYVWNGSEWQPLHKPVVAGLNFNQEYFDLPSGQDARALTAQNLEISWTGGIPPTWSSAAAAGLNAISFTGNPITPTTLTTSPTTMTLLPDLLGAVPLNPWYSKESELTFIYSECGQTKKVTFNQTNYAFRVNNQFTNSQIIITSTATGSFAVHSNTAWNAVITGTSGMSTVAPSSGGVDLKNSSYNATNVTYNIAASAPYDISSITFQDTATIRRSKDITVSVVNCQGTGSEPTIEEWAGRAGFSSSEIAAVTDAQAGSSAINTTTGIQLHRDQNGNLFLSGDFGATAGRWMLHNVRATNYAATGRTDGTTVISPNVITESYASNSTDPLMGYPNVVGSTNATSPTEYNKSQRLGRLYNWPAATMKKGGSAGNASFTEGETSAGENHNKVQGICPNGWHLPSDKEFTTLELEIRSNVGKYSGLTTPSNLISTGFVGYRGGGNHGHGKAMKDPCSVPDISTLPEGASNIISMAVLPGMNWMLAGASRSGSMLTYDNFGYLWTSSGNGTGGAWFRAIEFINGGGGNRAVYRNSFSRDYQYSVRCKKD